MKSALTAFFLTACLPAGAGTSAHQPWEQTVQVQTKDTSAPKAAEQKSDPVALLMVESQGTTAEERLAYAKRCEKAAKRYTESAFRASLFKRIGDVYFDVDPLQYAGKWHAWYAKAAATRPSLIRETPIGYRLQEYSKISLRKNLIAVFFAVYVLVSLAVASRAVRNRRAFDVKYFLKKCAVFLAVFSVLGAAVFALDLPLFSKSVDTAVKRKALIEPTSSPVRPLIPLSAADSSAPARAVLIVLLGFLPITIAVFYTSFKKPYSRAFLSTILLAFWVSLWLHFVIAAGFDEYLKSNVMVTPSRVVFPGEPEELLRENPRKALRANPALLKNGNDDLEEFIQKHYPEGFPGGAN